MSTAYCMTSGFVVKNPLNFRLPTSSAINPTGPSLPRVTTAQTVDIGVPIQLITLQLVEQFELDLDC